MVHCFVGDCVQGPEVGFIPDSVKSSTDLVRMPFGPDVQAAWATTCNLSSHLSRFNRKGHETIPVV